MKSSRFKVHSSWLMSAIFVFGIFNFIGCVSMSKKNRDMSSPAMLEPQAMLRFVDVPVPVGFKLLANDSFAFESSGVRIGVLKYQGKANPDQVVAFYKEQMPMYNWNLLNIIEYGNRMLNFDRDTETCIVNLLPKSNNAVIFTVSVGPKSQASSKKATKPIK